MKQILIFLSVISFVVSIYSCTPNTGCTETTADNFDPEAENDDGTCIPARDKMIGNYTYTRFWVEPITEAEGMDNGGFQVTEANTGNNAFNMFLNGNEIIQGSVSAKNISIEPFTKEGTWFGLPFTQSFTGSGMWLVADTVDMTFSVTTLVPVDITNGTPPQLIKEPLTYHYYCTKVN